MCVCGEMGVSPDEAVALVGVSWGVSSDLCGQCAWGIHCPAGARCQSVGVCEVERRGDGVWQRNPERSNCPG